jgi:hypothetical protein
MSVHPSLLDLLHHAVVQLLEALRYKPEGSWFDPRWLLFNRNNTLVTFRFTNELSSGVYFRSGNKIRILKILTTNVDFKKKGCCYCICKPTRTTFQC